MKWTSSVIEVKGEKQEAIAPIILSASRATDIPAGFAKEFEQWLTQGYCIWTNPFSGKKQYVSFENARMFIFWTKNPQPFMHILPLLDNAHVGYYFSHTLNDYEREAYELNIPCLKERVANFKILSGKIGKEKVLWRFDPLLLSEALNIDLLLKKIEKLGNELCEYTDALIFSFIEIESYNKVKSRTMKHKHVIREFTHDEKFLFAKELALMIKQWQKQNPEFSARTCAQNIDFSEFNILPNKCIDDMLIAKLYPNDKKLMDFIGWESSLFGVKQVKQYKDKNQRKFCQCIPSKDIGKYGTCSNACIYCYAGFKQ